MTLEIIKKINLLGVILAFVVITLGAYVRLSDAGLGCPDWPGCYGKMIVPGDTKDIEHLFPERPLEHGKAWKEMIHRYAAGTLGMIILFLAVCSWKYRKVSGFSPTVPSFMAVLVLFQALLGMWTVTLLLKPIIVMGHLLGGMAILSLLFWQYLTYSNTTMNVDVEKLKLFPWAIAATIVLVIQISLGGWTSANYAALACPDLPRCQGMWWPAMNFDQAFVLWHRLGINYEGGILSGDARMAIHVTHRLGAIIVFFLLGGLGLSLIRNRNADISRTGVILLVLLVLQISLGVSNVLLRLPLLVAVAHNGTAALLLLTLITLIHQTRRKVKIGRPF